jgi:hypothetical protein
MNDMISLVYVSSGITVKLFKHGKDNLEDMECIYGGDVPNKGTEVNLEGKPINKEASTLMMFEGNHC